MKFISMNIKDENLNEKFQIEQSIVKFTAKQMKK
jgi:hypothetical protein